MNSIQAIGAELELQLRDLETAADQSLDRDGLFVGSGDSFCAATAARLASGNSAQSAYPTDLVENPSIIGGRNVYFVSISGRTRANVLAAKVASKAGAKCIAITEDPVSPLAAACGDVTRLQFSRAPARTAGISSFTASLVTCASIATGARVPRNVREIHARASAQATKSVATQLGAPVPHYFLGDGVLFPIGLYCAMKFTEVFGTKALAYPAEEFCHSPVFGIEKKDRVVILGGKGGTAQKLDRRLRTDGYKSALAPIPAGSTIDRLLYSTFFAQALTFETARRRRIKTCHFLQDKRLLKLSSDFIYG